jgi:hypothetical protein
MTQENEGPPFDPIAEMLKHLPKEDVDTFQLMTAIQSLLVSVQTAGRALDRALWGIIVLAAICIAQLLALVIVR